MIVECASCRSYVDAAEHGGFEHRVISWMQWDCWR